MKRILSLFVAAAALLCASCGTTERYDIVIAGGGTSGIAAGLQAARMGSRTLIVEEFDWLGGMLTAAGVSATDGNYRLRGGIWGEFREALAQHYGGDGALKTGWVSNVMFEPSVGDALFKELAAREPNLTVEYRSQVVAAVRKGDKWQLTVACGDRTRKIEAAVLIDATELGDIAALCGVAWDKGMDAAADTGEEIAPAEANGIIQDLTYVAVLKEYGRDVALPEPPDGYDPSLFACCCINPLCINPKEPNRMWPKEMLITYGKLPNGKYMINWPIEGNDYYADLVELSPGERAEAVRRAKNHTLGFVYFLQHELGFRTLGVADDEFPTDDGLPFIPYHRESRRIRGAVRFTLRDICEPYAGTLYRTAAGVGDYPVDQHHTRYSGWDALPDLHFHPIPSYGFPLGIVLPEGHPGLLVPRNRSRSPTSSTGRRACSPSCCKSDRRPAHWLRSPCNSVSSRTKCPCGPCRRRCSRRAATCCPISTCPSRIRVSGLCSASASRASSRAAAPTWAGRTRPGSASTKPSP